VQRTDYVFDIAGGAGGVAPVELGRLDAWFQSLQLGYGDRVSIDAPYGDEASRRDIAGVVASYGMLLSQGAPVTAGAVAPGSVRVIVSRSTASMPNCPNWDRGRYNMSPETSSNYGCAVNGNLAAMIADPNDLVRGQAGPEAADPASVNKVVKFYRDLAPTGNTLKSESTGGQ
jgi:pilus assembly protein CpaD